MPPISTSWSVKGNGQTTFSKLRTIDSFILSTSDHSAPTNLFIQILLALADVLLDKLASCCQGILRRDVRLYIWMAYLLLRLQVHAPDTSWRKVTKRCRFFLSDVPLHNLFPALGEHRYKKSKTELRHKLKRSL